MCVLLAGEESEITFLDSPPDNFIVSIYCLWPKISGRLVLMPLKRDGKYVFKILFMIFLFISALIIVVYN